MPAHEIGARFLAIESGVELNKARNRGLTERDFGQWKLANLSLVKRPLHIVDALRDVEDVSRTAFQLVAESGVKLVVIDYLQLLLMRSSNEGRYTTVGLISNQLKSFALLNRVAVLALAQLSRAVDREDRIPGLSDLRDSGCIEQDADVICLLHRKETPTRETTQLPVQLYVAKNRNGEVGSVPMIFRNRITRYEEAQ